MARPVPKKEKVGYALRINRSGEAGADNWERVGFLFGTSLEADKWRKAHFPKIGKYSIYAIRVCTTPVQVTAFRNEGVANAVQ